MAEASAEGRRRRAWRTACRCCGLLLSRVRRILSAPTRAASSAASTRRCACTGTAPRRTRRLTPSSALRPLPRPRRPLPTSSYCSLSYSPPPPTQIGRGFLLFMLAVLVQKILIFAGEKKCVTLQMKGAMANVCLKHLKYNDLVHVSGLLNSYHKVSGTGEKYMCYKIHVKELNYVHDPKKPRNDKDSVDPASTPSADSQTLEEIKYRERLRLWQVFFASPYEWWDNRQYKPYASCPDFKHKDTREQLWLHPDDPPWVRKQLELIDQQTAESGRRDGRGRLTNPRWNAQAFNYSDECDDDEQDTQRQANG
uniref:Protein OSB1, mitochondrial n=2 Tax=Triticum urartu TaxID=4572 RepID=A0A8R7U4A5_TRIUA